MSLPAPALTLAAIGELHSIDLAVIAAILLITLGIGVFYSRRARQSTESYFKTGSGLPWWLLGTSIVATTFAADTPLAISGFVATDGNSANWFWWCQVPMVMAGVFFFAHLWRRANPMTDMELIDQRYSGREAGFLRGFKALYLALPYGCLVMGWVNKAMAKVLGLVFPDIPHIPIVDSLILALFLGTPLSSGISPETRALIDTGQVDPLVVVETPTSGLTLQNGAISSETSEELTTIRHSVNEYKILFALFLLCLLYTVISGLWGVVVTDFFQFWIAMGGCVFLAVKAIMACGGMESMMTRLAEIYGPDKALSMTAILPPLSGDDWFYALARFLLYTMVGWWAVGFTDGGSYHAQRLLAAKNGRHAALGYFWFGIANYALRMWPWILVGIAAAVLFPYIPGETDAEAGFVKVMLQVLGPGWLGLLVATFFSAYMSTISTQLNLGASYLVNDFYKPFVARGRSDRHYLRVGMAMTAVMALAGIFVSLFLSSIADAWLLLGAMNAGIGVIYILRWYWWRISAWSEIACLGALIALSPLTVFSSRFVPFVRGILDDPNALAGIERYMVFPFTLLYSLPICISVALLVTILTRPVAREKLRDFYLRVQPGGPGWRAIEREIMVGRPSFVAASPLTRRNFLNWGMSVVAIYSFLVGIGKLVIGNIPGQDYEIPQRAIGLLLLLLGGVLTFWLVRSLNKRDDLVEVVSDEALADQENIA
ncbi:Na+:solute symporter [bacterium]|nr:Na+:solute symporter [bacterium]